MPERAAGPPYDLIVVGGGIYGIALCLEAARHGQRTLLVERQDFGGATSWSNLRILHGGLRYLQSLDLRRFYESIGERRWFMRHFPELVRPLPCLMPLYGRGLKRPSVFRLALTLNNLLSWRREADVVGELHLPAGRLVDAAGTARLFPQVDRQGLQGGALWHDAVMLSPERIAIEMLRWACACGATALNYVEATGLIIEQGAIRGIEAHDRIAGGNLRFRAPRVVNAAGPWSRQLAKHAGKDVPELFRPAVAFNLLLDRPPIAEVAVAVEPRRPAAPTYFCLPWKGMLLAGTRYVPAPDDSLEAIPDEAQIAAFLADLNAAVPGLGLTPNDVLQTYAGLLPARAAATIDLANREVIHDHGTTGGPSGFFSVSGVKFTTARRVAQKTLTRVFGRGVMQEPPDVNQPPAVPDMVVQSLQDARSPLEGPEAGPRLRAIVEQEAVQDLDDLLLRRMDSAQSARDREAVASRARALLRWDEPSGAAPGGVQRVGTGVSPR